MINVKMTHDKATFHKNHEDDSGWDLTCVDYEIKEGGRIALNLGIQAEPPEGHYFDMVPRSSFSKTPFIQANSVGIIDQGYRGNWYMMVRYVPFLEEVTNVHPERQKKGINNGDWMLPVYYEKDYLDGLIKELFLGKRVAQAILRKFESDYVNITDTLGKTHRGENGFGSSGG